MCRECFSVGMLTTGPVSCSGYNWGEDLNHLAGFRLCWFRQWRSVGWGSREISKEPLTFWLA